MRALVMEAVHDEQLKILLDTGANISAISESLKDDLKLKIRMNNDKHINSQDIVKSIVITTSWATIKVTIWWEVVYKFEVWIMPPHVA